MNRSLTLAIGLVAAAALLAGCASAPTAGPTTTTPYPDASTGGLAAGWLDGGGMVGVVTWGSSTCPPTLAGSRVEGQTLTVDLQPVPEGTRCTFDYVSHAYAVPVAGVDPAKDLRVVLDGPSPAETVLAGVAELSPAVEGEPSAGWTQLNGLLVMLTWGSSSCPPQIADATVAAPGRITVTEAAPPADRICTADFAPRATAVDVAGALARVQYELSFVPANAGGASSTFPIAGVVGTVSD